MLESFGKKNRKEGMLSLPQIEQEIGSLIPSKELAAIFGPDTYLIGGAIRDVIFKKKPSDFDFMTRQSIDVTLKKLAENGYREVSEKVNEDNTFSIKLDPNSENRRLHKGVITLWISGSEIQMGFIDDETVEDLIKEGDLNLSCCAYNVSEGKIINPEVAEEVNKHVIKFSNPEQAKTDPEKILNALKQISRFPDLIIDPETKQTIESSIPLFIQYFTKNPHRRYKLASILGNINTAESMRFFENQDANNIFEGLPTKKEFLVVDFPYVSKNIAEVDLDMRAKISAFVKDKFGKRFDDTKLFNEKINSIVYQLDENSDLCCCCLMDGERMYATASKDSIHLMDMVENMCKNNYNIWTTISTHSRLLIAMSEKVGLKIVQDPELLNKILVSHYPRYKGNIVTEKKGDYLVFFKKESRDTPQVLLRS